ncbi:MAG: hypothetical protein IAE93_16390 [Ignavibacteria bacterium]|nr:hypothetical protein [Ignavibacteria bacterium]HRJ85527.1 hypothetical protein [Ignavibacteria bacterium]
MENNVKKPGFFKYVIISSLIVIAVGSYPLLKYFTVNQINSIVFGYIISLVNAIIGYQLNTMAFSKPTKSFMVLVFGGMGIRLIIVLLFLVILLQFTGLDSLSLVGSVFFFYTLFISIEIYFLHKMQSQVKKHNLDTADADHTK